MYCWAVQAFLIHLPLNSSTSFAKCFPHKAHFSIPPPFLIGPVNFSCLLLMVLVNILVMPPFVITSIFVPFSANIFLRNIHHCFQFLHHFITHCQHSHPYRRSRKTTFCNSLLGSLLPTDQWEVNPVLQKLIMFLVA